MSTFHELLGLGLLLAAPLGCAAQIGAPKAASVPTLSSDQIATTVEADIQAPPREVFRYVVREDTPARDLRSYGPIAGVRGGVPLTEGGWDHPGATRIVVLESGDTLREEIERIEAPTDFRYRVHDFSFSIRHLAREGRGFWQMSPTRTGTHVTWTYVFTAKSCAARAPLRAMLDTFFEPYMERGLESIRRHVESGG